MSRSATLRTREPPIEEKHAPAPLLTQSLEDHRLAGRIERALRASGYGALRTVRVSVNARVVILVGRVPSYYMKQVAQVKALAVPGTHAIHNDVEVISVP